MGAVPLPFNARRNVSCPPLSAASDTRGKPSQRQLCSSCLDEPFGSAYLAKAARALCNGKTLAFQAKDAGSIPAARSNNTISDSLPTKCALLDAYITVIANIF